MTRVLILYSDSENDWEIATRGTEICDCIGPICIESGVPVEDGQLGDNAYVALVKFGELDTLRALRSTIKTKKLVVGIHSTSDNDVYAEVSGVLCGEDQLTRYSAALEGAASVRKLCSEINAILIRDPWCRASVKSAYDEIYKFLRWGDTARIRTLIHKAVLACLPSLILGNEMRWGAQVIGDAVNGINECLPQDDPRRVALDDLKTKTIKSRDDLVQVTEALKKVGRPAEWPL